MFKKLVLLLSAMLLTNVAVAKSKCENWPCRPVQLIISLAPGGPADTTARVLAQEFEKEFGQPLVLQFAPGGDGLVGMNKFFSESKTDDHVLLHTRSGTNLFNYVVYDSVQYDKKEFNHVALLATFPYYMTVSADSEFNTVADLSNAKRLNIGVTSPGESLVIHQLAKKQGWKDYAIVTYKGNAPMNLALLSKEINLGITLPFPAINNVKDNKLKFLASITNERFKLTPSTPTLKEQGLDIEFSGFYGIAASKTASPETVNKLNAFFKKFANNPEVREKFEIVGCSITHMNVKRYNQWIDQKITHWETIRQQAGIEKIKSQ